MAYYAVLPRTEEVYHFGIKRRSGRYPYGSGERPYQRERKSLSYRIGEAQLKAKKAGYVEYRKKHPGKTNKFRDLRERRVDEWLDNENAVKFIGEGRIKSSAVQLATIGSTAISLILAEASPFVVVPGAIALGAAKIGMDYLDHYKKSKKARTLLD